MTSGWKIGLSILAGVCLLLLLGGGACLYVFSRYGKEFAENAKHSETEGRSFGKQSTEADCLKEGLARAKKNGTVTNIVSVNMFFGSCLEESTPTPGFCDGVPSRDNREEAKAWGTKKCAEANQSGIVCDALYQIVASHCHSSARKSEGAEPPPPPKAQP